MADGLVKQFLAYSVALGLTRPGVGGLSAVKPSIPKVKYAPAQERAPSGPLRVTLPTGQEIGESTATATFISAISSANLQQVADQGYILAGEPLVGKIKSKKYPGASKAVGAWFVMTHSSTAEKARVLKKVSKDLELDWRIDGAAL